MPAAKSKAVFKKQLQINASWTSVTPRHDWRHFRISGKRLCESGAEFEMMAVCDREVRFWVPQDELRDPTLWQPGWQHLELKPDKVLS